MSTQRNFAYQPGTLPVWGFSDKIRKARDLSGLGQKEFAARVNLTASTLAAYETGRSSPRFNDAPALAKRLQLLTGIPADWFLVIDDPNGPKAPSVIDVKKSGNGQITDIFTRQRPADDSAA